MGSWWQRIKDSFHPGTIRSRLRTSFVLMVLLPAFAIILGSSLASYYNSKNQSLERLESVATLKQFEIQAWITSLQTQLANAINEQYSSERASVLLQLHSENWSSQVYSLAMRNRMTRFLDRNPQFHELTLVDPAGKIILSTDVTHEGIIFEDLNGNKQPLTSPLFRFSHSPWDPNQVIFIASIPVNDSNGNFLGVMAGLANLSPLQEILASRTSLGNTGVTFLIDEQHTFIDMYSSKLTGQSSIPLHTQGIDQAIDQHLNGVAIYANTQGIRVIGSYRWIPEIHLALLNEQNLAETAQGIITALEITVGITLLAVMLAVIASLRITRSIASPIEELAQTAVQITRGDLHHSARIIHKDEIGSLAVAFNSMTAQLRDLITSLEARVDERTHALQQANQALQQRAIQMETSAQVSREVTSILTIDELLHRVVELIHEAFSYAHVQIYLLDPQKQNLVLRAASGETSSQIIHVEMGSGNPNREAARVNQLIVINDVVQDQRYPADLQHPDTRSELVTPLRVGEQVIGTLDVQSAQASAFQPEDQLVIQSLADQIAIAIENARLYDQSRHLAVLEERNRLARELHDSVTQSLYSLSLLIEALQRKFHTGRPVLIEDYLTQFAEVTQQSLKEMRLLVYELRPPVLEKDGLIGALRQRLEAVEKRTGVEARLVAEELVDLPDALEEELYWIAQEALNNALKHANASEVEIHFSVMDGKTSLEICDNGQGFDYEESFQSGGMGLRNMAERADRIGGQLEVHSDPGQGTTIKIKAPMNESTSGKIVSFNPSDSQEMNE